MPVPLVLEVTRHADSSIVQCSGRLTANSADLLHTEVKELIPGSKSIVLDLEGVTHMDSMGLAMLVRLYGSTQAVGCRLQLRNLNKRIKDLLTLTNVLSLFEKDHP